jgi:hypothetical protein
MIRLRDTYLISGKDKYFHKCANLCLHNLKLKKLFLKLLKVFFLNCSYKHCCATCIRADAEILSVAGFFAVASVLAVASALAVTGVSAIARVPSCLCPATSVVLPVLTFFRGNLLVSCSSYQSQCCFTTSTFCRCLHSRCCWRPFGYKGVLLLSFFC